MRKIKIENGKIYSEYFGKTDVYEIVERIPVNFFIWNIGENMGTHDYIPLCEDLHPGDKDDYSINPDTLKAIKLPENEVKLLRDAAAVGVNSLSSAEKALKSRRRGYMSDRKREQAEKVIDIFMRIS